MPVNLSSLHKAKLNLSPVPGDESFSRPVVGDALARANEAYALAASKLSFESDPLFSAWLIGKNPANWDTAYGWGNHASAGYLTAASPLDPSKVAQTSSYRFVTDTEKTTWNGKQAALSGTGFIKIAGSTISYDNSTYLTGNQTVTLGGILSGSGATSITAAAATGYYMPTTTDQTTWNAKFTLPSLTSGSVLFSNGTTISQDNAKLFWDNTNKRLGLGTTSPSYQLHVKGATGAHTAINVDADANRIAMLCFLKAGSEKWQIGMDPSATYLKFYDGNANVMTIAVGGLVSVASLAITGTGGLTASGQIISQGVNGCFHFRRRDTNGDAWQWASNAGEATLYNAGTTTTALTVLRNTNQFGFGVESPSARIHAVSLSEQLRLGYDLTKYFGVTVDVNGVAAFDAVGSTPRFSFADPVRANGFQSADGSPGITQNVTIGTDVLVFKNGIAVGFNPASPEDPLTNDYVV